MSLRVKERRKRQGRLKVVNVCWESPQPAEQPEKLKKTLVLNSTSSSSRDTDQKSSKKGQDQRLEPCARKISQQPPRNQKVAAKSQPKNFPEHPEHSSSYFKPGGIQQKKPIRDAPPVVEKPLDFGDLF